MHINELGVASGEGSNDRGSIPDSCMMFFSPPKRPPSFLFNQAPELSFNSILRLRMSGVKPLLPPCTFMAWTRTFSTCELYERWDEGNGVLHKAVHRLYKVFFSHYISYCIMLQVRV